MFQIEPNDQSSGFAKKKTDLNVFLRQVCSGGKADCQNQKVGGSIQGVLEQWIFEWLGIEISWGSFV